VLKSFLGDSIAVRLFFGEAAGLKYPGSIGPKMFRSILGSGKYALGFAVLTILKPPSVFVNNLEENKPFRWNT